MNTIKTTLTCSCCGAPINFEEFSTNCPFCDSPYADFIIDKMEEERKNRETAQAEYEQQQKDKIYMQQYLAEQARLSKLPKASTALGLYLLFGAFGAHWFYLKEYYKGGITICLNILMALSFLNDWIFIGLLLFAYTVCYCEIIYFPLAITNNRLKKLGIEVNLDVHLKPKRKYAICQDFEGSTSIILFRIAINLAWISLLLKCC